MEKKTITINPELLKIKKTRKNRPSINPKLIKRKLLKRIKDHEKNDHEKNDFKDSTDFLSNILKKKTLQTLPNETPSNLKLNYKIDNEIAHGCLRNGIKQCYRSYKNSPQKINHVAIPIKIEEDITKRIIESEINKAINGKTEFSTELLKKHDESLNILEDISIQPESIMTLETSCVTVDPTLETSCVTIDSHTLETSCVTIDPTLETSCVTIDPTLEIPVPEKESYNSPETEYEEPIQVKRTVKRKFTLGKNKNKIGVLIKNKRTKKNALDYSKELKKITTEEIKKYLRDRGLMKVGSSAPPEIVRKIFENTKMAGDIINENNILNNLINENN